MKRILLYFALIALFLSCGSSKSVSYTHKPLAEEGCSVAYSALQQDGQLYIFVTVKSDRLIFNDTPSLMLKNFEGGVLTLEGVNLQSRTETSGMVISNVFVPISEVKAMAQFPVDATDIDFFKSGISKVRLSTVPIVHEKSFSSDKIGKYLYTGLLSAESSVHSF
jgi:hypothetical protein